MSFKSNVTYFAAEDGEKLSSILQSKANDYYRFLHTSGYFWKISRSWSFYENVNTTNSWFDGSAISFGGEQGELAQMSVNQYKNIADHIIAMIISTRPAFQAKATNTDSRSLVQAKLANQLLDYYQREKRLEKYIELAVRYAVVLGCGYVRVGWNATSGEIYDHTEDGAPIYEGDLEFTNVSPFDVYFDATKGAQDHDWYVVRSFKNKYDLIAKYPDLEESIRNLPTKNEMYRFQMGSIVNDETDDIPYYEFFHRKSESIPHGRYMVYLDKNVVLLDGPMPYRDIPIYRIAPSNVLGTPYGSSPMFDLMPLQEAVNSLYSTILSNQHAFGVQNIAIPRNANINFRSLEGGLNLIEYDPSIGGGGGKPEALQLTATPQEVFTFLNKLESEMERISGINSVVRGNPESSLKSGTALAMVQSTALQFISPLQMSYVRLLEDIGTSVISILRDFATVPRVAMVAGKSNTSMFEKEFTGEDLQFVNRVVVEVSNPLATTTAGRVQIAQEMLQYGLIKKPEDYFTVINTGNLDIMMDDATDENINIKLENEKLLAGKAVKALAIDQHKQHILTHRALISDPDMRENEQLQALVLGHISDHINMLKTIDPALLNLIGEQSLAQPPQQGPQGPQQGPQGPPPQNGPQVQPSPQNDPGLPGGQSMPSPSKLPESPNGAPVTAQESMNQMIQPKA